MGTQQITNSNPLVVSEVKQQLSEVIESRSEKLLEVAKEKEEFLEKILKVRTYSKIHENKNSKDFQVILYAKDLKILTSFILNYEDENPKGIDLVSDFNGKELKDLTTLDKTTYALLYNNELDMSLQVVNFINAVANGEEG